MYRLLAAAAVMIGAVLGAASAATPPPVAETPLAAPATLSCARAGRAVTDDVPAAGSGLGLWSSQGGQLIGPAGPAQLRALARPRVGVVRHVTSVPGVGLTFALDRRGGDLVIATIGRRTVSIPQRSDVMHPTLSSSGALAWSVGSAIRIKGSSASPIREISVPFAGSRTFAPFYVGTHELGAVLAAPPDARSIEGSTRDNLYRVDLRSGRWRPITAFRATGDHWVAIRTPVAKPAGGVEFVRVTADASETAEPRFELWEVTTAGQVRRIEVLDREMYLAGRNEDGQRLWNLPAAKAGASKIMRELKTGRLVQVGCGSVLTDPLDVADPDRQGGAGVRVPPRSSWPDLADAPAAGAELVPEVAIIVGDYVDRGAAEIAAAAIRSAYPTSTVEVVDNAATPLAIMPGVWGALLRLPIDADPTQALAEFRAKLPAYQATSWVVTP
jgi:hypothetical protein